jgi:hypothetical protein
VALTTFDGRGAPAIAARFPNVHRFLSVLGEEKALHFPDVERDRRALVESLVEKLKEADLQELVNHSVDLRAGKVSHNAYHSYLRGLCGRNGFSLAQRLLLNLRRTTVPMDSVMQLLLQTRY